jgi:hypothetical protein
VKHVNLHPLSGTKWLRYHGWRCWFCTPRGTNQGKVYVITGPEYGALEGHTLIIRKSLNGWRTLGARYHERLLDTLHAEGYRPLQADPDVWMKDCITHYDYLCVYVDESMVMAKGPKAFLDKLMKVHKY